jgi:hypothetical protein
MPTFDDENANMMDAYNAKGIQYSGVRPANLGATDYYTLVTIVRDISGSVSTFQKELEESTKEAVKACGKSPNSGNLVLRMVDFNNNVKEVHGFKELRQINVDKDYLIPSCYGGTALHDGVINGVRGTQGYAKTLFDSDFLINAIIFIETDGDENASRAKNAMLVKEAIDDLMRSEYVESCIIILIGVNTKTGQCTRYLQDFQKKVGITAYKDIEDFDNVAGAKMAQFISKSVSSQAQMVGTGGPSQILSI